MFGGILDWNENALDAGEKARLVHGVWLTRALGIGGGLIPRIPVRRVSEGGFAALMRTREGRGWAEGWWASALTRLDDV